MSFAPPTSRPKGPILEVRRTGPQVKLPAIPPWASMAKLSGTAPKPPDFALRASPRSPLAIPPRASARGFLAKASEMLPFYELHYTLIRRELEFITGDVFHNVFKESKSEVKGVAIVEGRETAAKEATKRIRRFLSDDFIFLSLI